MDIRVIHELSNQSNPFLSGILTDSLQQAGLDFEDAYSVATTIKNRLAAQSSLTSLELRQMVVQHLVDLQYKKPIINRYKKGGRFIENQYIVIENEDRVLFSRSIHTQRLISSGLSPAQAHKITHNTYQEITQKKQDIKLDQLIKLTYRDIEQRYGIQPADRYLMRTDFLRSGLPLIILLSGVPGSGKSTIATDLANQFGIVRTQSTDMLREVMRILVPKELSPVLHESSFKAGESLANSALYRINKTDKLLYGFQRQSEMLEVACSAVIKRAINDNVAIIIEGVHIRPNISQKFKDNPNAVVVPVMLAVPKKSLLKKRLSIRSIKNTQRRAARYLENFETIWGLQKALMAESNQDNTPIVYNTSRNEVTENITQIIMSQISFYYNDKIQQIRKQYL